MDYLHEVGLLTKQALIQAGVITPCEHHPSMLIYRGDSDRENRAFNLACYWVRDRVGTYDRADVRDAIKGLLSSASRDECPECARKKDRPDA